MLSAGGIVCYYRPDNEPDTHQVCFDSVPDSMCYFRCGNLEEGVFEDGGTSWGDEEKVTNVVAGYKCESVSVTSFYNNFLA